MKGMCLGVAQLPHSSITPAFCSVFQPISSVCHLCVFPAFPDHLPAVVFCSIAPQTSSFAWSLCCSLSLRKTELTHLCSCQVTALELAILSTLAPNSHQSTGIRGVCHRAQFMPSSWLLIMKQICVFIGLGPHIKWLTPSSI